MEIIACGRTDKGLVRPNNEDGFYIDDKAGLLVVADGMGGRASGEIASKLAIDVIRDYFRAFKEGRAPLIGKFDEEYSETSKAIGSSASCQQSYIRGSKQQCRLAGHGYNCGGSCNQQE